MEKGGFHQTAAESSVRQGNLTRGGGGDHEEKVPGRQENAVEPHLPIPKVQLNKSLNQSCPPVS